MLTSLIVGPKLAVLWTKSAFYRPTLTVSYVSASPTRFSRDEFAHAMIIVGP